MEVNFIKINTFLLHKQLLKVKGLGAIWASLGALRGLKQQNFTFGGLTMATERGI